MTALGVNPENSVTDLDFGDKAAPSSEEIGHKRLVSSA